MYPRIVTFSSTQERESQTKSLYEKQNILGKRWYLDGVEIREKYMLRTLQEPGSLKRWHGFCQRADTITV